MIIRIPVHIRCHKVIAVSTITVIGDPLGGGVRRLPKADTR